jgi:flagellar basal body-associated protein FliL
MGASNSGYVPGRMEELQRENDRLRDQLRRTAAQVTVASGAIQEAVQEKEATARIAHQVAVEERATRAAVETQGSNLGLSLVLQILNFVMLIIMVVGLFAWLPREIQARSNPSAIVTTTPAPGTVIIPR